MPPSNIRRIFSTKDIDAYSNSLIETYRQDFITASNAIAQLRAEQKYAQKWYEENLAEAIQCAANKMPLPVYIGYFPNDERPNGEDSDIKNLESKLNILFRSRPKIGVTKIINRGGIKLNYLNELLEHGKKIVNDIEMIEEKEAVVLKKSLDEYDRVTQYTCDCYLRLSSIATTGDASSFLEEAKTFINQPRLGRTICKLLFASRDEQPSLIERFMLNLGGNAAAESSAAGKLFEAFGNHRNAYLFGLNVQCAIKDESLKNRWASYTDTYAGAFIPIPNHSDMNIYNATRLRSYDDQITINNMTGSYNWSRLSKKLTYAILSSAANRPGMLRVNDKNVINANNHVHIKYSGNELFLKEISGNYYSFRADKDEARDLLETLSKAHGYEILKNDFAINLKLFRHIYQRQNELHLVDISGNYSSYGIAPENIINLFDRLSKSRTSIAVRELDYYNVAHYRRCNLSRDTFQLISNSGSSASTDVSAEKAAEIYEKMQHVPGYIYTANEKFINTRSYEHAAQQDNYFYFYDYRGNSLYWKNEVVDPEQVFADLKKLPNFFFHNDKYAYNLDLQKRIEYKNGKLYFTNSRGGYTDYRMSEDEAQNEIAQLAEYPSYLQMGPNILINPMQAKRAKVSYGEFQLYSNTEYSSSVPKSAVEGLQALKAYHQLGQKMHAINLLVDPFEESNTFVLPNAIKRDLPSESLNLLETTIPNIIGQDLWNKALACLPPTQTESSTRPLHQPKITNAFTPE